MLQMDHQQVESSGAIDSYVLGHLTPQEMDLLDVHFFECSECSKQLNQTAMFLTNARVVLREQLPEAAEFEQKKIVLPVPAGNILQRFLQTIRAGAPVFASLVFLGLYVNEALVVNPALQRELDAPATYQSEGSFPLKGITRGEEDDAIPFSKNKKIITVYFDTGWTSNAESYVCNLRKQTGEQVIAIPVSRPLPGQPMYVGVPTRVLESGAYTLAVMEPGNQNGKALAEYLFQLRQK